MEVGKHPLPYIILGDTTYIRVCRVIQYKTWWLYAPCGPSPQTWVQVSDLLLTSYMTLDNALPVSQSLQMSDKEAELDCFQIFSACWSPL